MGEVGEGMTNYNERLDDILDIFHNKMLALETITNPCDEPSDEIEYTFDEAKQLITSLIKELVAEAKKQMANNLIDQEIRLHKIYADDPNICVGVKLMADEVREYFDDGIYTQS